MLFLFFHTLRVGWVGFEKNGIFHTFESKTLKIYLHMKKAINIGRLDAVWNARQKCTASNIIYRY